MTPQIIHKPSIQWVNENRQIALTSGILCVIVLWDEDDTNSHHTAPYYSGPAIPTGTKGVYTRNFKNIFDENKSLDFIDSHLNWDNCSKEIFEQISEIEKNSLDGNFETIACNFFYPTNPKEAEELVSIWQKK